jgi:hypothetical protein
MKGTEQDWIPRQPRVFTDQLTVRQTEAGEKLDHKNEQIPRRVKRLYNRINNI